MADIPRNPIAYSSRTMQTILTDINNDAELVDKPNWWKRIWAGVGDVISIWLNALANLLYLSTAFTRSAVKDLCALIDYTLSAQTTSSGLALFFVDTSLGSAIYPFTVVAADLKARSTGTLQAAARSFGARAAETFTLVTNVFTTAYLTNNELTVTLDLAYTGHKVRLGTAGTLSAPLKINTDYFVIYVSATKIKLAPTLADAFAGNEITLTSNGTGAQSITLYSKAVALYQQDTLASAVTIGTSDGMTEWQEFILPDKNVLQDTLTVIINSVTWTRVDTFIDSTSVSTHYKVIPLSDNQFSIRFGNGTYGAIPVAFPIQASYSYGGGTNANVNATNRITIYAGAESKLSGVTNPVIFTGGGEEESIENAKMVAPLLLKARDRFVTVEDGEALVLNYGGVSQVKINKNVYGLLSAQVVGIANGGGDVPAPLRATIQAFLIARTVLESIDVRFVAATITSVAVTSAAKMLPGYAWADVEQFFRLGYRLILTEAGKQIKDTYTTHGIADTVALINQVFTTSFGVADYDQISKLVSNMIPRDFGDTINTSDVFGFLDAFVDGVDYLTITTFGTGLPLVLATSEITTPGVLTLTEIP